MSLNQVTITKENAWRKVYNILRLLLGIACIICMIVAWMNICPYAKPAYRGLLGILLLFSAKDDWNTNRKHSILFFLLGAIMIGECVFSFIELI